MTTPAPSDASLTSPNNAGQVKSWALGLKSYVTGLLGTDGTVATALSALGLSSVVKTINSTSPDSAGNINIPAPDLSGYALIDVGNMGVGSVLLLYSTSSSSIAAGGTMTGFYLRSVRFVINPASGSESIVPVAGAATPTGTWKNIGGVALPAFSGGGVYPAGFFRRIA